MSVITVLGVMFVFEAVVLWITWRGVRSIQRDRAIQEANT